MIEVTVCLKFPSSAKADLPALFDAVRPRFFVVHVLVARKKNAAILVVLIYDFEIVLLWAGERCLIGIE